MIAEGREGYRVYIIQYTSPERIVGVIPVMDEDPDKCLTLAREELEKARRSSYSYSLGEVHHGRVLNYWFAPDDEIIDYVVKPPRDDILKEYSFKEEVLIGA